MKRTSDRLATFLNKKLTQAATVFEPQSAPSSAPSQQQQQQQQQQQYPPFPREPQQGQPLYSTQTSEVPWTTDSYHTPQIPNSVPPVISFPHTPVHPPPVTNAALESPYPPNTDTNSQYPDLQQNVHSRDIPTPAMSIQSSQSSYAVPSPYILPPSTHTQPPQTTVYMQPSLVHHTTTQSYYQRKTTSTPEICTPTQPPKRPFHSYDALSLSSTPMTNLSTQSQPCIPSLKQLIHRRTTQAAAAFPNAVIPLSRALDVSNEADLDLWRYQLDNNNACAIRMTHVQNLTSTSIFTLSSATETNFSTVQWTRLKRVLTHLSSHHNPLHIILPSPPHTRLLPCATYPLISLSALSTTLSEESTKFPWVFLEEVSASWGGGVIYACETRGSSVTGIRESIRYVQRTELEVTECMRHTLRNVLFGAVNADKEIVEMAKWTFKKGLAVGVNWRDVLVHGVGGGLLPSRGVWLDGSRTIDGCWNGGVQGVEVSKCVRVVATDQTLFLVRFGDLQGVWVLVGDVGRRVWSKIVCGEASVELDDGEIENGVGKVLTGMVGRIDVVSVAFCDVKELG